MSLLSTKKADSRVDPSPSPFLAGNGCRWRLGDVDRYRMRLIERR
jgi:hypothetical protein